MREVIIDNNAIDPFVNMAGAYEAAQDAIKRGVQTESELLADLLRRVERIEEHLGITN